MHILSRRFSSIFPAMRISIALVLLTSCILLSAEIFGFTPQEVKIQAEARSKISEALALQMSVLIPDEDIKKIQKLIRYIVKRNPDILSAAIRSSSGKLLFYSPDHQKLWGNYRQQSSTTTHVLIPILQRGELWGNVELLYEPIKGETFLGVFDQGVFKLMLFVSISGFFAFLVFMLRILRQLDPSAVIPGRVNAAFDTLAEGVVILDEKEHILLANKSFCEKIGYDVSNLIGVKASELKWKIISAESTIDVLPWIKVIDSGNSTMGSHLMFRKGKNTTIKFAVNASPIMSENDKLQGVLVTLDDISELEKNNSDLKTMVTRLQKTQLHVQQQNKELSFLATRDSLTGCLNRRSFSEQFEARFQQAKNEGQELACIMVDIDHFKLVNDNYGHATGDLVIKMLAEILKSKTRNEDLVGRYGGEEFCLVLPGMTADIAMRLAEQIRLKIKDESAKRFSAGPRVTASLGVATINDDPQTPDELNHLADEALYIAKESGRNKVIHWAANAQSRKTDEQENIADKTSDNAEVIEITHLKTRVQELEEIASKFSSELEYAQNHDVLTGLPNQILFCDRIQQLIERNYRQDQLAAVVVIDIDKFSQINTSLGRHVGDHLLQLFARQLNGIFRKQDSISRLDISRFGADEFAVLLTDITHQDEITWVVKRLLDSLKTSYEIDGHTIHVSTKIGVSVYPTDAGSVDELLNNAMTAKKFCKSKNHLSSYQFFDAQIQQLSVKHQRLEKELREAIKQEQWVLFFQPKMNLLSGTIIGAEALLRWKHPERGLVSPYEFIEFAEQRKLITSIGDWVIEHACQQIKKLIDLGFNDCKIGINLSSVQLMEADIVRKIFSALDKYGIPPKQFEIEITESTLIENIQVVSESLKRLNARGISIAIDDFGTGYSSLSYLKNLPIDYLKIDRSFIKDICHDHDDEQIVKTIISMAHSLDLMVVAEGVEDREQMRLLNRYGCDEIQGYLLSKPVDAQTLVDNISNPLLLADHIPPPNRKTVLEKNLKVG
jgi:diguanylate cyclase (GGDEF)-like protein/PAS domain S-box-containing protein